MFIVELEEGSLTLSTGKYSANNFLIMSNSLVELISC